MYRESGTIVVGVAAPRCRAPDHLYASELLSGLCQLIVPESVLHFVPPFFPTPRNRRALRGEGGGVGGRRACVDFIMHLITLLLFGTT